MAERNLRDFGFARVAIGIPLCEVVGFENNCNRIIEIINEAKKKSADVLLFPELSISGYTASDLFHHDFLLKKSEEALKKILVATFDHAIVVVVGMPVFCDGQLFNCAVFAQRNKILGIVPKTYIPGYKEFYEKRWFSPAKNLLSKEINFLGQKAPIGVDLLFKAANFPKLTIGIEICEDLWVPNPPSSYQALAGATLLLNLSASNELVGKADYRRQLVVQQSSRCIACYSYCSSGVGESTTDVVFSGHGIIAENGDIVAESQRFSRKNELVIQDIDFEKLSFYRRQTTSFGDAGSEAKKEFRIIEFDFRKYLPDANPGLLKLINPHPFVPQDTSKREEVCQEVFSIQTAGLAKRLKSGKVSGVLIGISGGLDSTLALLVCVKTFDMLNIPRENIHAVTMPGFGTSKRTHVNASDLCNAFGVSFSEIDIKKGCEQQLQDINHALYKQDVAFQNTQARYRMAMLLNLGNEIKALVVGTGDLSEIALGWCTYGGDHLSHYNVNTSVPKTLVKYVARWFADTQSDDQIKMILYDILRTPISPELTDEKDDSIKQKTEDIIGPYELHDFFLYCFVRWGMKPEKILFLAEKAFADKYSEGEIKKWLAVFIKMFFGNQWKRSCMPDGPKVGSVSLSPRGDWRMASDAEVHEWLNCLERLKD